MTDKQIIIDGVDVVECPHRKKEVTFMNVIKCYNYGACEGVNCLYKQLARKEQECEELIDQRDKLEFGNNILEHERNKYKQALDEIEKQVKAINNECFYDASCDCNNCDMKNNCPYYRKVKTLDIINSVKDKNVPHKAKDGEQ